MIVQYQSSKYAVYDHEWPTSVEEIKSITEWFACGDSYLSIWLEKESKMIGFISLNQKDNTREYDLGYCYNFDYHKMGYAEEGCHAVLEHAFNQLYAERIISNTATANKPSCQLLERLGMKKVGENNASFHKTQDGEPIEFIAYTFAISNEEWFSLERSTRALTSQ